jgi:uncharacterized protein (DUF427 family)
MRPVEPTKPEPGQESVWDYPRPPRLETTNKRLIIRHAGEIVAETSRGYRVLETSHPPNYYFPPEDIVAELRRHSRASSMCEWKGSAVYFDAIVGGRTLERVGWTYPDPTGAFEPLREHIAFYAASFDECLVDGERVIPQPGRFYGGWITQDIVGPFKGEPGTMGW